MALNKVFRCTVASEISFVSEHVGNKPQASSMSPPFHWKPQVSSSLLILGGNLEWDQTEKRFSQSRISLHRILQKMLAKGIKPAMLLKANRSESDTKTNTNFCSLKLIWIQSGSNQDPFNFTLQQAKVEH